MKSGIVLAVVMVLSGIAIARAETEEGRQACTNDAFQFCADAIPDRERVFRCLEARKQQDPALESLINDTKVKVAAYMAKVEANKPKINPVEQAKDAGLVRLGIKKRVDDREVVARI